MLCRLGFIWPVHSHNYLTHGSLHNWNEHNSEEEDQRNGDVTRADRGVSEESSGAYRQGKQMQNDYMSVVVCLNKCEFIKQKQLCKICV